MSEFINPSQKNFKQTGNTAVPQVFPSAPRGKRLLAFIIDALIACLPVTVFSALLLAPFVLMVLAIERPSFYMHEELAYILPLLSLLSIIWFLFYSLCRDGLRGKQSLGKKVCGIMVINIKEKRPCNLRESMTRNSLFVLLTMVSIIPLFFLLLLVEPIAILRSPKGLRIGDGWSGTQVVEVKRVEN